MSNLQTLKFYCTPAHRCSYLPDREAVTLFLDPKTEVSAEVYSSLTGVGFRRSGDFIYRPHCGTCNACIPVRIPINQFEPNRGQKRCLERNSDLMVVSAPPRYTPEYYSLYEKYINARHQDGDMYPPTRNQFRSFLLCSWGNSRFYEFRSEGRLVALAVVDPGEHRLPEEHPPERHAVETSGEFSVLPGLYRMRVSRGMQRCIGIEHPAGDPGAALALARCLRAGSHHVAESLVEGEFKCAARQRAAQRAADMDGGGIEDEARIGRPPEDRVVVAEPGKDTARIGGDQALDREIAADGKQAVRVAQCTRQRRKRLRVVAEQRELHRQRPDSVALTRFSASRPDISRRRARPCSRNRPR